MTRRVRSYPDMTSFRLQRAPGGAARLGRHASGAIMALALLTACGGSSNPVTDTGTPGETMTPVEPETPTDEGPATPTIHEVRHVNATAEDLRDHWHEAGPIADALEVTPGGDGALARGAVEAGVARGDATETAPWRTALGAGRVEVLGERDGYVVATARGGPAGHLDIRFDYARAPATSPRNQVLLERASKAWAARIRDPFAGPPPDTGPRSVKRVAFRDQSTTGHYYIELLDHAALIRIHEADVLDSYAGHTYVFTTPDDVDIASPRLGMITLGTRVRGADGYHRAPFTMVHEVGHAIGFTPNEREPAWHTIIDFDEHVWIGSAATAVHGGPVPLQWRDPVTGSPVAPGTPNARPDRGHIGPCTSILSYCAPFVTPSELDFALFADIGFDIAPASVGGAPELYSYGAWGKASGFEMTVERTLVYPDEDTVRAVATHYGEAPETTLGGPGVTGRATWDGLLIGVDTATAALHPVTGDAAIAIDLATLAGEARFADLKTHIDGATASFREMALGYAVAVDGNAFADPLGRIDGAFYGAGHEEMAGTLDDADASLLAAFGGSRRAPAPR